MQSCIDPGKFPVLVTAVHQLCGYMEDDNAYKNPSLALKIGHTLKKCASTLRSIALIEGSTAIQEKCNDFKELLEAEWNANVSSAAHSTLEHKKWNKPHRLPLTEDLRRVTEHLIEERRKCLQELKNHPSTGTWHAMAKAS